MRIVITGALGHIGSRLIRETPSTFPEADIVMLDNLSTQRYCSLFNLPSSGRYRFLEADILTADLASVLSGADVAIHLAAITNAPASFEIKDQVERVNFVGTQRVAQACVKAGCALIFPSTTSVYGTQAEVVDEDCPIADLCPQSPYAESKLKAEQFLQALGKTEDLRFVICRFGTIVGASIGMRFHTAVNKFCWQTVMGQPLTVWRTALHQKRPYLALDDAVKAIGFIIENDLFDQRIYNVLTENLTVNSIIQFIEQHVPQLDIQFVDTVIMNQLSYDVSNLRFRKQGFESTGSVEQSIVETIELLRDAGGNHVK